MLLRPKLLFFIIPLFLFSFEIRGQYNTKSNKKDIYFPGKSASYQQKKVYLFVGTGSSIYYHSDHRGMLNNRIPLQVQLSIATNHSPLSIIAGANLRTSFVLNDFRYSPTMGFGGIKYSFLTHSQKPLRISPYVLGGVVYCSSYLTDIEYSEIKSYSFKQERDSNPGYIAGAGLGYRFDKFDLQLQYQYSYATAGFIAGYFDKQTFYMGSHQVNLLFTYRFHINKKNIKCPSYKSKY